MGFVGGVRGFLSGEASESGNLEAMSYANHNRSQDRSNTARNLGQLGRVLRGSAGIRRGGAAALDLAYLASGSLDAFWELDLFPWDYMAGVILIREAGGVIRRIDGSPIGLDPGTVLAAANSDLARAIESLVNNG